MNVIIIGGGASGIMAAIKAADSGHRVTIIEHKDKIGKKILVTGNGRCNLSNEALKSEPWRYYDNDCSDIIKSIFNKFGYEDSIAFFESIGLYTKSRNGLIYPYSDQASAILDVLRFKLAMLGVKIYTECNVNKITCATEKSFEIDTDKGLLKADRLILATGGQTQPKTGSDGSGYELAKRLGHKITPVTPGLVQLRCKENYFKSIAGVRVGARLSLYDDGRYVYSEAGELQITDYGISGIAVMNLSNRLPLCRGKVTVSADLLPHLSEADVKGMIDSRCYILPKDGLLTGLLPKKLGGLFLKLSGITGGDGDDKITEKQKETLVMLLKGWMVEITGTKSFNEAQISLGGVDTTDIRDTLESRLVPGLYFAGELLNIHGDCGGFNLQLAWTTGAVAGMLL